MKDYQIILEQLAFDGKKASIKTKERGVITGTFTGVDEFEADPERLGFCIDISGYEYDIVFIDEIIDVSEYQIESVMSFPQSSLRHASGK